MNSHCRVFIVKKNFTLLFFEKTGTFLHKLLKGRNDISNFTAVFFQKINKLNQKSMKEKFSCPKSKSSPHWLLPNIIFP